MIDQSHISQILSYCPDTGSFTWLVNSGRARIGCKAGNIRPDGYAAIVISGKTYYAHRLAWLISYGDWPESQIDHINGVRSDNRIKNLRPCSQSENLQNMGKRKGISKYTGVTLCRKTGRWIAEIGFDKKRKKLGRFDTEEDAYGAYLKAKRLYHSFQPFVRN